MNKNEELLPYYEKARELLDYNPKTGIFTWAISRSSRAIKGGVAGRISNRGYRQIGISIKSKEKVISAHRLAYFICNNKLPNEAVDHINGDKLDNRIINLRSCTLQQNQFNRGCQSNSTSGFKGVSWYKRAKKWQSQIQKNGKGIHLGYFSTPKEASDVYQAKARELYGEFYRE